MKEIDFLPEWYKKNRRRRMGYKMQYAIIFCIFAAMIAWSFFTARSISNAQAAINRQEPSPAQKQAMKECTQILNELSELDRHNDMLRKLDGKVAVADVLAELSFLVDSKILLTQVDMQAVGFDDTAQSQSIADSLRVARNVSASQGASLVGDVRFKVALQGMACEAGDAARLICNLENSPYFCRIMPDFSRTAQIKGRQVSEFGINCYIANYRGAKQ